jgi:methionyl aminopeptidase
MTYAAATEAPHAKNGQIKLHGPEAFAGMHRAGKLTAQCLDMLSDIVKPGVTTQAVDDIVVEFARDHGAVPAPLNYRGYPNSICTSINHVVCHGDASRMYALGDIGRKAERLLEVTYECLLRGIGAVKAGARTGDIGHAIQTYAESERCSVVRDFCGHGLGRVFHDTPNILHYGRRGEGIELKAGMFFTIEPMINAGRPHVKILSDGWTAVTRDRSLSAQYEHTVGVTETGCEIFTLSPAGLDFPPISQS